MDALITHIQDNMVAYAVTTACLLPLLYLTRRWTAPVFFYSLEIVLYSAIFHLAFGGAVRFLGWFKEESRFRYWETNVDEGKLTTPITGFWIQELYTPYWLFHVEIGFFAIIVFIVLYFRPMNLGAKNRYRGDKERFGERKRVSYQERRKSTMASGRPRYSRR